MAEKKTYLLEFPDEDYQRELKTTCALVGKSMKQFILDAVSKEIIKSKEKLWVEGKL